MIYSVIMKNNGIGMNITIVGAGNIGTQVAVHAAAKGHSVTIFTDKYYLFSRVLTVVDDTNNIFLKGEVEKVTNDSDEAFLRADIIMITLPAFCQKEFAESYIRYARKDLYLIFFPGTGGCECIFNNWIKRGVRIFGLQRVPSVARLVEYGKIVKATGYRDKLFLASIPNQNENLCCSFIADLFDIPCFDLPNYLNVTLIPSNAILHTSRLYSIFKDYRKTIDSYRQLPLFYEDWDLNSAKLLLECDEEVQQICSKINLAGIDVRQVKSLKEHYESVDAKSLMNKISSIKGFKGLETPYIRLNQGYLPDLESRYFKSDFPYGLHILQEIGDLLNVSTPVIDMIWSWYKSICPSIEAFSYSDYGINNYDGFISFYCS